MSDRKLTFGTGGIRAIMGPGDNQLNVDTIRRNTYGYAEYIKVNSGKSVVIAYDNRNNSFLFANEAAKVLSECGIEVYLFESLRPTPELSFAVRHLNAFGGIVITASHNPPEYNGYKIYDSYGCQCVPRDTDEIIKYIDAVDDAPDKKHAEQVGRIIKIGKEVDEAYYDALCSVQQRPGMDKNIKIVYTPLHGTGYVPVMTMLKHLGYDVKEVSSQCYPDGDFSNTDSPNPENPKSFSKALILAEKEEADLVLATDPDCDRMGAFVRHNGEYKLLSGNQTGAILLKYILESRHEKSNIPDNAIVFDSIVTSDLGARICEKYGVERESTLTGFKYIGDKIREYDGNKTFLFGYEESFGYMIGDFTRDKDGVQACIVIAEAAQYYHNIGKTLYDVLSDIYDEFGYYEDVLETDDFPVDDGSEQMEEIMFRLRNENIDEFDGRRVVAKEDYLLSVRTEKSGLQSHLTLPKSNVLKFYLEDGSWVVVRPSGNEPKLKYYKNLIRNKPEKYE